MSKREEKRMRERLESDRASARQDYGGFIGEQAPERAAASGRYGERYGDLLGGYQGLIDTGGLDPTQTSALRKGYGDLATTGGFDPSTAGNLKSFYGGMLSTGGYTPQDISNIRGRSNSAIPAVYSRLKENLHNRLVQQSGYGPGYGATIAKLGRQAAQDTATTARDTETEIADRLRQGKLTGAAGEFGLESALRQGRIAGLAGGQGLEESLRSGRMAGLSGIGGLASADLSQMTNIDRNRLAALSGQNQAVQGTYSPDLSLATRPGLGSNLLSGLGVAASFAAPFMGGFNPMSLFSRGSSPLGGVAGPGAGGLGAPPDMSGVGAPPADWLGYQPVAPR